MGTPANNGRFNGRRSSGSSRSNSSKAAPGKKSSAEHEILFQNYFKSVGPRTYAAQVKKATNGNHYLVLTEGRRDENTNEVRKTRLFIFSEDFPEFFRMMKAASEWVKANPVAPEVAKKRKEFWAKNGPSAGARATDPAPKTSPEAAPPPKAEPAVPAAPGT